MSVSTPVAIVGMALRAPGDGSDPERFWKMLLEARTARSAIPKDRYNIDGFYHPDPDRLGSIQQTWVLSICRRGCLQGVLMSFVDTHIS